MEATPEQEPTTPSPQDENTTGNGKITVRGGGNQDQPASLEADTLGFKPYVEAVFSYLQNPQTKAPFTLSVEGEWGAGKSSFMFQLEQSLKAKQQKCVRFNAWRHDKVESMWAAFALHFIKDLLHQLEPCPRIVANIQLRWRRFDWAKGWFSVVKAGILVAFYILLITLFLRHSSEFAASIFKDDKLKLDAIVPVFGSAGLLIGLLFFLNRLSEVTGNPFKADLQKFVNTPNYEGNVAFIEQFHRDFNETVDILSRGHSKVFVFVDDLDRADIPKAAELMQGLNMMIANSPKLIFIIGMDREKVAAGVAAKYKDLLPFLNPDQPSLTTGASLQLAREFGYQFLEKFIQLSFQVPKPSGTDTAVFIRSLSIAAATTPKAAAEVRYNPVLEIADGEDTRQFQEITLLLAPFFEDNPRRIKQFVNAFRLKAHIAHSTGLFTDRGVRSVIRVLSIPQLGKFIALTILFPALIPALELQPGLFAQVIEDQSEDPTGQWNKNKVFMDILHLSPKDGQESMDYDMSVFDVLPLLETSPAYKHPEAGKAQAGNKNGFDPGNQTQSGYARNADGDFPPPANAPNSGFTGTTTTTTTVPPYKDDGPHYS